MMDKFFQPEPPSGGESVPLSFNLNQAAALCGVSAQQLREWTECGYINATGMGDRQRYNREALRQILAVRDAVQPGRVAARRPHRRASAASPAHSGQPADGRPEARRPEEFTVPKASRDDDHLAVQIELFFSLNVGAPQTSAQLAGRFDVTMDRMERVLEEMLRARRVLRVRCDQKALYFAGRAHLRGPSPREQRVRATRRHRTPTRFR